MKPSGYIEIDLFPEDVDRPDHPEVVKFKRLLLELAEEYNCFLVSFGVNCGTVTFAFNSDELTAKILTILQHDGKN